MRHNEALDWLNIAVSTAALGIESAGVIGLRVAGAAIGGPKAADEAWRMWSEKIVALTECRCASSPEVLGQRHPQRSPMTLTGPDPLSHAVRKPGWLRKSEILATPSASVVGPGFASWW